jgi:twitching motility two-component system response regulator PilH
MMSHPKILVVDDSLSTCLFIANTLEQAGYDMEVALTGQEGLAKVARFQPYCLILDVVLPDISGYAICRYVQQHLPWNKVYIILISAKNAPLDQSYGLRQGAHRYLPKPFTAEQLVQMVREGIPVPLHHSIRANFSPTPQESVPPSLLELMPRRVSNSVAMRTSSPFARTPAIADDQAHQLYAAIDGRRTLAELAAVTGLEAKTVTGAIRALLKEDRIRMYDSAGQLVESAL